MSPFPFGHDGLTEIVIETTESVLKWAWVDTQIEQKL